MTFLDGLNSWIEAFGQAGRKHDMEHAALVRLSAAVAALGVTKDGKTLFEISPIADQDAYEAWLELNGAQGQAVQAISGHTEDKTPTPTDEQKAAFAKAIFDNDYSAMGCFLKPTPESDSTTSTTHDNPKSDKLTSCPIDSD